MNVNVGHKIYTHHLTFPIFQISFSRSNASFDNKTYALLPFSIDGFPSS